MQGNDAVRQKTKIESEYYRLSEDQPFPAIKPPPKKKYSKVSLFAVALHNGLTGGARARAGVFALGVMAGLSERQMMEMIK